MKKILTITLILSFLISIITCKEEKKGKLIKNEFKAKVVYVQDGDSLIVKTSWREKRIRLAWIDCPELKQRYGIIARLYTKKKTKKKTLLFRCIDKDRYDRLICFVVLPNKKILNEELLKKGLAWNYKEYSDSKKYEDLEKQARKKKIGLWKDKNPMYPQDFRILHRIK